MDLFKHFSHDHGLNFHQMPQGSKGQCSGCQSPVSGNIYACWQCNHFLHEQCFHAARSLQHPSHPPHPLTLVQNPTYQSGSFHCQSCKLIGNGFSYACAECQFDMHVHCALSPKQNLQVSSLSVQNYNPHMPNPTNSHMNTQNFSPHHYNAHPLKPQHPHTNTHNSTFPQQNPPVSNYSSPVSIPYTNPPTNNIPTMPNSKTTYETNPPPLPPPFYPATMGAGIANQNSPFRPTYSQIYTQAPNYNPSVSYANPVAQTSATIQPWMSPPAYLAMNQSPQNDGLAYTNYNTSTTGTDQPENVYLSGLIANETQQSILELWDEEEKES